VSNVAVTVSRRAERDLKRLDVRDRRRCLRALSQTLRVNPLPANADDRELRGHPRWHRLCVDELRILWYEDQQGRYVERVIHRRELERAVGTLPD
jgi:mRNA-degrading endonuclease RelE of RelBE toxin-antitoxin system